MSGFRLVFCMKAIPESIIYVGVLPVVDSGMYDPVSCRGLGNMEVMFVEKPLRCR
jgi:hypothetical protein